MYFCCFSALNALLLLLFLIIVHTSTSAAAGPQQAVHWLAEHEHEHDFDGELGPSPQQVAGTSPVPSVRLQGAGVAGILRREAQLAARNDE